MFGLGLGLGSGLGLGELEALSLRLGSDEGQLWDAACDQPIGRIQCAHLLTIAEYC